MIRVPITHPRDDPMTGRQFVELSETSLPKDATIVVNMFLREKVPI